MVRPVRLSYGIAVYCRASTSIFSL